MKALVYHGPRQRSWEDRPKPVVRDASDAIVRVTATTLDTSTTPVLMRSIVSGRLSPKKLITHRFALDGMLQAYDTFADAARERALKVVLHAG